MRTDWHDPLERCSAGPRGIQCERPAEKAYLHVAKGGRPVVFGRCGLHPCGSRELSADELAVWEVLTS